jgi:UDP-GlcNAc:undecaprenyl-phosphate/decaprenyl-phosphate GlcNAc-1-phosphate transferase
MHYIYFFCLALFLSVIFTFLIKKVALKSGIVDSPGLLRKIHKKDIPLLGGTAIFLAFFVCLFFAKNFILSGDLQAGHWFGFFIGSLFLIIGGFFDDKYKLSPGLQIIWPVLAIISVILGGVSVEKITNPLGGLMNLSQIFSVLIIFVWLMAMMYTTKLLDGVDGLVSGVSAIGALIIFLFTLTTKYYQPDIAMASFILFGATLGFLIFNWHPAKIFLGEGGSLFMGFALGVLAIISGGKIAITLLFMGIPILDLFWTILRRLAEGKNPFKKADKMHLHHRLLALGLSQEKTVSFYLLFALVFGLSGLFLQSFGKIFALLLLLVIMIGVVYFLNRNKIHESNEKIPRLSRGRGKRN